MKNKLKTIGRRVAIILLMVSPITMNNCDDFLEKKPKGVTTIEAFTNEAGVNYLLIGAYSTLDGAQTANQSVASAGSPKNWPWNLASDDATKGSTAGDIIDLFYIETYQPTPDNPWMNYKWTIGYDGIARANEALKALEIAEQDMDASAANSLRAQARFIRGFWHLRLQETFWQVPYITEAVDPKTVKNDHEIWPEIEADLQFAIDNLPDSYPGEPGRATKWAAKGIKAYAHLFQHEYSEAKTLLDDIINSGRFELATNYRDNFSALTENNKESIFELQQSVNDGSGTTSSSHGNLDSQLCNGFNRFVPSCCGFYQPTQDLVNAFKVDENGLPLLGINGPKFNDENLKNDYNIPVSEEFIPTDALVDPRLDQTVGRRGVDFLGWGIMTGAEWIRAQAFGGPYLQKKLMYSKSEQPVAANALFARQHSINYRYLRYARVLLWRAEVAVEDGDLEKARELVNQVRRRAANPANITMGKVLNYKYPSGPADAIVDWNQPAANYLIEEYPAFPSQEYARTAVRMEQRLEFGMEGHRFFDLVRWGVDDEVLPEYIEKDTEFRYALEGAVYTPGKNSRWPIPRVQLDAQPGILEQDPLWK